MQFLRAGIDFSSFENVREMTIYSRPIFECLNKLSQYLKNRHLDDKGERLEKFINNAKCDESSNCDRCGIKIQIHSVLDFATFYFKNLSS